MEWSDLRYFLGVARSGSLTKTALMLGVSPSTVARRIQTLENNLGSQLFTHHQTGYFLTDRGQHVFEQAEIVEGNIASLERTTAGLDANTQGLVRLATAEAMATNLIIPALPAFIERYPAIQLEIITGVNRVDLSRYEADMALRFIRPERGNLSIRRLSTMKSAVYGSVAYLERHPADKESPLSGRQFINWNEHYSHLPAARWIAEKQPNVEPALATTSVAGQISAAQAGLGLAILPCFIAEKDAGLVEVIPPEGVFSQDLWLVTHTNLTASARIKAVGDFLAEICAKAMP